MDKEAYENLFKEQKITLISKMMLIQQGKDPTLHQHHHENRKAFICNLLFIKIISSVDDEL